MMQRGIPRSHIVYTVTRIRGQRGRDEHRRRENVGRAKGQRACFLECDGAALGDFLRDDGRRLGGGVA
jgi:hypothetical protein